MALSFLLPTVHLSSTHPSSAIIYETHPFICFRTLQIKISPVIAHITFDLVDQNTKTSFLLILKNEFLMFIGPIIKEKSKSGLIILRKAAIYSSRSKVLDILILDEKQLQFCFILFKSIEEMSDFARLLIKEICSDGQKHELYVHYPLFYWIFPENIFHAHALFFNDRQPIKEKLKSLSISSYDRLLFCILRPIFCLRRSLDILL